MEVTLVSSMSVEAVFLFFNSIVGRYVLYLRDGFVEVCSGFYILSLFFLLALTFRSCFFFTQEYLLGDYWCLNLSLFLFGLLLFYGGSKHYRLCPIIYGHCQVLCRPCGAVYICVYTGCISIEGFL
jgi:hypothetical protein